jgi:hypothetical protein
VRILTVGIDLNLLETRQAVLTSRGYDSLIATPGDIDEKLQSGRFDLVILSVMLSPEEKRRIQSKLPAGTRALVLESSSGFPLRLHVYPWISLFLDRPVSVGSPVLWIPVALLSFSRLDSIS